jgi:hypothetical protein
LATPPAKPFFCPTVQLAGTPDTDAVRCLEPGFMENSQPVLVS